MVTLSPSVDNGNLSSCYDGETEILTPDGWVRFDNLREGMPVAQVATDTIEMSFAQPQRHIQYHYTGPMYHWVSKSADVLVMPHHRMVYLSEWMFQYHRGLAWQTTPASVLPQRFYLPQAVQWRADDILELAFAGRVVSGDDFARFMGAWIAEGCTRVGPHDVVISQDAGEVEERFWMLLQRLPFHFRRVPQVNRPPHVQFKSSDRSLYEALRCFGKSGDKYVPQEIKRMSSRQIQLFLDWYTMGDGNHSSRNQLRILYVSKSPRLIDDIQELLLRVGKTGAVQSYENCSRLEVRTHNQGERKGYKWYGMLEPEHFRVEPFNDEVFGVAVPAGALMLRRKRRTFVAGSCVLERSMLPCEKFLDLFAETGNALASLSQAGLDQASVSHWFQTDEQFRLRYLHIIEQHSPNGRGPGKRFTMEQRQCLQEAFLQAFANTSRFRKSASIAGVSCGTVAHWIRTDKQFHTRYSQIKTGQEL